jgi:hypothetical protein
LVDFFGSLPCYHSFLLQHSTIYLFWGLPTFLPPFSQSFFLLPFLCLVTTTLSSLVYCWVSCPFFGCHLLFSLLNKYSIISLVLVFCCGPWEVFSFSLSLPLGEFNPCWKDDGLLAFGWFLSVTFSCAF